MSTVGENNILLGGSLSDLAVAGLDPCLPGEVDRGRLLFRLFLSATVASNETYGVVLAAQVGLLCREVADSDIKDWKVKEQTQHFILLIKEFKEQVSHLQ